MRFSHRVASALVLVLAASAANAQQAGQSTTPTVYVQLDYMKVAPGKADAYVKLEQEVWKPFHQQRVKNKEMLGWQLFDVSFTADTHREYDYVTANAYDNMAALEGTGMLAAFQKLHPGKAGTSLLTQTEAARQVVRSEIWARVDQTAPMGAANSPALPFKYLVVDYMRSKNADYEKVETELWKPIHQDQVKRGAKIGWGLYGLVLPGGTSYPYDYATINQYTSLSALAEMYPDDIFKRVLPNISITDIGNRTGASRDLTRRELWILVDATR